MTREQFLKHAQQEIDAAFVSCRNRIMNLVQQAYAEGKKHAETDQVADILQDALKRINNPEASSEEPDKCENWAPVCDEDGNVMIGKCLLVRCFPQCNCGGNKDKCDYYGG